MDDIKALLMKEVDKTYTKKQWNNKVKAKIRKRLYDGIYGIVYGAKSKMFFIEPYQLEGLGFEADKVKRLGKAYETQNIGCGRTPFVLNCKGYDAILIGLGSNDRLDQEETSWLSSGVCVNLERPKVAL